MEIEGENYLSPIGGVYNVPSDVKYGAVNANWVLGRMADAGMGLKFVMLDACRNNPLGRSWSRETGGGLAPMQAPEGALIAYATDARQTAEDGATGRNSPYTTQLLRYLPEPEQPAEVMF